MGAKVGPASKSGMDEINVTPLIDVVLVLLIIFMVLTPITVEKMASNLPPTDPPEEPPPDVPPDQLLVAVYGDGTLALNLKPEATDEELHEDIRVRIRGMEKKTVFVDADPKANYGRVVQVIDLARDAGATTIGFAELKDEGPTKLPAGVDWRTIGQPVPAAPGAPGAAPAGAPAPTP